MKKLFLQILTLACCCTAFADITLSRGTYQLVFSDRGELLKLTNGGKTVFHDGTLFELTFADGKRLTSGEAKFLRADKKDEQNLVLFFTHKLADVKISVKMEKERLLFSPSVTSRSQNVFTMGTPARFLFPVGEQDRVYMTGMLGLELLPQYFRKQTLENAIFGDKEKIGEAGLREIVPGAKISFKTADEIPVLTSAGRKWLGSDPGITEKLPVVRPSSDKDHLPLLSTSNGTAAALYSVGKGAFLRMGTRPAGIDKAHAYHKFLKAVLSKLAKERKTGFKVGRVTGSLGNHGLDTRRNRFLDTLRGASAESGKKLTDSLLRTWPDLEKALLDPAGNPVIVNYLYEAMPVRSRTQWKKSASLIRRYMEKGGIWIDLAGGYSFYQASAPKEWNSGSYSLHVDGGQGFSDFLMKTGDQPFSVYGVQTFPEPVSGKKLLPDEYPLVTRFGVIPFASGIAEYSRYSEGWSTIGKEYRFPASAIRLGGTLRNDYLAYGRENNLTKTLSEKVRKPLLDTWKKSLFLKINDKSSPISKWTEFVRDVRLPGPVLYHHADWTHQDGRFDEYYPDYFPLDRKFGTKDDLKRFYDTAKSRGSLVMAYMNPIFWDARTAKMNDRPVVEYGMEKAGIKGKRTPEAMKDFLFSLAMVRDRSGKIKFEWGGKLIKVSPWHPVMIAMNEKVYDTFIRELGTSIYFNDSVGAERCCNDYGPNVPYPTAHLYSLLAMANGLQKRSSAPLATEGGGDLFMQHYSMFCGVNHYLMPTSWNVYVPWLERYALGSVRPFPFAQFLAHDKVIFIGHNLGNSVFCRDGLTWYLLGGYQLQFSTDLKKAKEDLASEASWLRVLSSIQSVVGPEMLGETMIRCEYIAPSVLETEYANGLTVTGNLQQIPYKEIAPYGFLVRKNNIPLAGIVLKNGKEHWFVRCNGKETVLKVPFPQSEYETTVEPSQRKSRTPVSLDPPPEKGILSFPAGVPAPVHLYSFEKTDSLEMTGDSRLEAGISGKSVRTMLTGKKKAFASVPAGSWLNGRTSWAIACWINVLDFSSWRDALSFGNGRFRLETNAKKEWVLYDSGIRSSINLGIPVAKNKWRFFLFNCDGRNFSVWSGTDKLEKIHSESISAGKGIRASQKLFLGARNDKGENALFCRIDELAVWSSGLSGDAVRKVFEAGKSGKSLR